MPTPSDGWHNKRSLEEVHRSVPIPASRWWRRLFAFAGPAYLVSVGYMDPGNWATDIEGGSQFGYRLIWVLLMSNVMAVLLQTLSARLGLVTGRDLAQACRDEYPPAVNYVLFVLCEIAIAACDLAEVLGSAIGLNLLFGIPVLWGVLITGFDVLLLLVIQRFGIRKMEAFILVLVATIGACFLIEIFLCKPSVGGDCRGLRAARAQRRELYVAIGILGATVMPHNLYLHSALVQSRDVTRSRAGGGQACQYNLVDSAVAMNGAFFVNAAILIVAAAAFYPRHPGRPRSSRPTPARQPAGHAAGALCLRLGAALFRAEFDDHRHAGRPDHDGRLSAFRIRPWLRRLMTRGAGHRSGGGRDLAGRRRQGRLPAADPQPGGAQPAILVCRRAAWCASPAASRRWGRSSAPGGCRCWPGGNEVIVALNGKLVYEQVSDWMAAAGGRGMAGWRAFAFPSRVALAGLPLWMVFRAREAAAGRARGIG